MGLKITKSIKNANGVTSNEHYINVGDILQVRKASNLVILTPQYWVSKAEKDAGSKQIDLGVNISSLSATTSDLEADDFYAIVYAKLKAELISKLGLQANEIIDFKF